MGTCLTARLSQIADGGQVSQRARCEKKSMVADRRTDVTRFFPAHTSSQVVVAHDELLDHIHKDGVFFLGYALEVLAVHTSGEDCFPAGHRIGTHSGVNGVEFEAYIGRRAARPFVGPFSVAGVRVVGITPLHSQ